MPKLTAIKEFRYASAMLRVGDDFEATEPHARLLKAVGRARDFVPPQGQKAETDEERAASKRAKYNRRDLTAES